MSILVKSSISQTTAPVKPWVIGGFALLCLCWGATWLPLKHGVAHLPPLRFVASRFLAGGPVLLGLSSLTEPWTAQVWSEFVAPGALMNWAVLVLLGPILGFSLYLALLRHWSAAAVAGYAYACPAIALGLGALIDGERPSSSQWAASLLLIAAAALVSKAKEMP